MERKGKERKGKEKMIGNMELLIKHFKYHPKTQLSCSHFKKFVT